MSEQQRARRRRQRQRRRQRRRDDAPPIDAAEDEFVEGEVVADDAGRPDDTARADEPQRGGRAQRPAARPNTIFGMPRFMFAMTVGLAAAFILVLVLNQIVSVESDIDAVRFPDQGRRHLAEGEVFTAYDSDPPTSGPHFAAGVPSGRYGPDEPAPFDFIPEPGELLPVLEAGGVVIHYNPDLVQIDTVPGLDAFFNTVVALDFVVVTANPGIDVPIVAAAWTYLLPLPELDNDALDELARFILDEDERFYGRFVLEPDPVIRDLTQPSLTTDSAGSP